MDSSTALMGRRQFLGTTAAGFTLGFSLLNTEAQAQTAATPVWQSLQSCTGRAGGGRSYHSGRLHPDAHAPERPL